MITANELTIENQESPSIADWFKEIEDSFNNIDQKFTNLNNKLVTLQNKIGTLSERTDNDFKKVIIKLVEIKDNISKINHVSKY